MNDIRLDQRYLPMENGSENAAVVEFKNIVDKCLSNKPCQGIVCQRPFVCVDLWMMHECRSVLFPSSFCPVLFYLSVVLLLLFPLTFFPCPYYLVVRLFNTTSILSSCLLFLLVNPFFLFFVSLINALLTLNIDYTHLNQM